MATITAQQIIDRATETLYDETNVRWTEKELLDHLSDAQRAAVLHLPEINPVGTVIRCASGTRQVIPGGWLQADRRRPQHGGERGLDGERPL